MNSTPIAGNGTGMHPNALLLRELYADLARIGEFVHEDVVLHPAIRDVDPTSRDQVGRAAVVEWERELLAATGGTLVMNVQDITANDHFGTVLGRLEGRFGDTPFAQAFCGVWRFEDGKATEHWENIYTPNLLASLTQVAPSNA
ncbi:nuclear transport factor 2 family protein [Streptomyces sp. TRM66268-LWL]|uniref:Nuclear transport factor 2 family protein n=1 Tax=Streptomyces polyasparticus TaxID=2767826 RepID=A0ABR7SLP2_9ACTN|nr:nuclear transport factor 2 family protein [Streptomyces polyasparticus]MBC9715764.1 nuclear transport factor 2 family protein [Streptomyces polyasparticus]